MPKKNNTNNKNKNTKMNANKNKNDMNNAAARNILGFNVNKDIDPVQLLKKREEKMNAAAQINNANTRDKRRNEIMRAYNLLAKNVEITQQKKKEKLKNIVKSLEISPDQIIFTRTPQEDKAVRNIILDYIQKTVQNLESLEEENANIEQWKKQIIEFNKSVRDALGLIIDDNESIIDRQRVIKRLLQNMKKVVDNFEDECIRKDTLKEVMDMLGILSATEHKKYFGNNKTRPTRFTGVGKTLGPSPITRRVL